MGWMRMWTVASVLVVGACVLPSGAQDAVEPPVDPLDYGVFALEDLLVGPKTIIAGAAGVNDGRARLRRRTRIDGFVAADLIRLGRRSQVAGLACTIVVGGRGDCAPLRAPLVPQSALGVVQGSPGPADVRLPSGARRVPLAPGAYRRLRIGRGSTLLLEGGDYQTESIRLARRARLACLAPCRITVRQSLRVGARATIGSEEPDAAAPADVRIDVQGDRVRTGIRVARRARIGATLYAPTTPVRVGRRARVTGAVVGRTVRVGARTRIDRP